MLICLKKNYSQAYDAYKNGHVVYRGDVELERKDKPCFYVKPGNRISSYTSNIYTKLMSDILDSWKDYPKRNHSLICTTNPNKSYHYTTNGYGGTIFVVFPKNNTPIGVASERDIWDSFPAVSALWLRTMADFNDAIYTAMDDAFDFQRFLKNKYSNLTVCRDFTTESKEDILKYFSEVDTFVRELNIDNPAELKKELERNDVNIIQHFKLWYYSSILSGKDTYDILNELLDPTRNKFKLIDSVLDLSSNDKDNEIWFSNSCLMIKSNFIEDIEKILNDEM